MTKPPATWRTQQRVTTSTGDEIRFEISDGGASRYVADTDGTIAKLTSITSILNEMWLKRFGATFRVDMLADRLVVAGVASAEVIASHVEAVIPDGKTIRKSAGEEAHGWIADSIRGDCEDHEIPQEHRATVAAAHHYIYYRHPAPHGYDFEALLGHPEYGYASRADLIITSDTGSTLVEFKTVGGLTAEFSTPIAVVAASTQLELLRLAAIRCDHPVTDAHIVVISAGGAYSVLRSFTTEDSALAVLAGYRASVNLMTVARSVRTENELRSNDVPASAVQMFIDHDDPTDWDEHEIERDLFDELFGPGRRHVRLFEVDDDDDA